VFPSIWILFHIVPYISRILHTVLPYSILQKHTGGLAASALFQRLL
jgi:hypothetical protein